MPAVMKNFSENEIFSTNKDDKIGRIYIISAPSGAGKTSLIRALLQQDNQLDVCVSHTTRLPRPGERNGCEYYFISTEDFKHKVAQNEFVEHAKVFGNYYGTSASEIERIISSGQDVVLEIDWQGADQVRKHFGQLARSIFILPPSLSALKDRLESRGQDDADIIQNRMALAQNEIKNAHKYDYLIINDSFSKALSELQSIFIHQRLQDNQKVAVVISMDLLNHIY